jgi:hypothetical protein
VQEPALIKDLRLNFGKSCKISKPLADWRNGKFSNNKDAYYKLYEALDKKDSYCQTV